MADLLLERSDGEELYCTGGITTNGWTVSWEGLEDFLALPLTVTTSANVLTDGSTLVAKRVEEAERTASIVYVGPRDPRDVRDQMLAFFNPKYSFRAHVTHLGVTRWCEGELVERQVTIQPDRYPCQVTFTILCPDPYMRGEDIHDESMTDASPMLTFPFECFADPEPGEPQPEVPFGCVASFRVYDGLNTVYNPGGIPAPFRITAKMGAAVTNPTFHVNGKFVKVVWQFSAGDELVIDFMAAPPTVTINGASQIQACTRDSVFVGMVLDLGANLFWYEVDSGDVNTMEVSIVYYERYMGV